MGLFLLSVFPFVFSHMVLSYGMPGIFSLNIIPCVLKIVGGPVDVSLC